MYVEKGSHSVEVGDHYKFQIKISIFTFGNILGRPVGPDRQDPTPRAAPKGPARPCSPRAAGPTPLVQSCENRSAGE